LTNYYVNPIGDEDGVFFLGPGDWAVQSEGLSLNASGFRSFSTNITVPGTSFVALSTLRITGDGRVPILSAPMLTESNTVHLNVGSQTDNFYALERSENISNWTAVATGYSSGGKLTLVDTNARSASHFYRAVLTTAP
jgi:hypothetical protein